MLGLKVIALISGGKDSLYSILHCLANGHEVVALANLYPPPLSGSDLEDGADDDINSYMYQTVGHSIIPLYEHALGLPLYRQQILGSAVNADKEYAPASSDPTVSSATTIQDVEDETESLVPLLQKVLKEHPEANAVSTGAILSTYQRTRVESVAIRLGLVPLSYLWQYTSLPPYLQSALLEDMAAVGQDARIIKVASGGLDSTFLWENVAQPRTVTRLKNVMRRFGGADGAVVGEGGEFETLAVDGPKGLWKRKIEVDVGETIMGGGGSASVTFRGAEVVEKERESDQTHGLEQLRKPDLLDKEFKDIWRTSANEEPKSTERGSISEAHSSNSTQIDHLSNLSINRQSLPSWERAESGNMLSILNMTAPDAGTDASTQLCSIMARFTTLLKSYQCEPSSVISSTLLLRSMSDFTAINPIYGACFTKPIPPSRVTVACGSSLPDGVEVVLSANVNKSKARRGLHVQSRSYWAPANIGPYSQAVAIPVNGALEDGEDGEEGTDWDVPQVVHVAGQIPLVPANMEIVKASQTDKLGGLEEFTMQTTLALQHLWRIGRVMSVGWWTGGVAFISHCDRGEGSQRAKWAGRAWRAINQAAGEDPDDAEESEEQGNDGDVWYARHGMGGFSGGDAEGYVRPALPDFRCVNGGEEPVIPPCFTVQVESLPRAADIEWTSVGLAKSRVTLTHTTQKPTLHITRVLGTGTSFVFAGIVDMDELLSIEKSTREAHERETVKNTAENAREDESDARSHTNFENDPESIQRRSALVESLYVIYSSHALPKEWVEDVEITKQVIPCQRVWDENGRELAAVVVVRRNTEALV